MNASYADTSMRDCVRIAHHGEKIVNCANQRVTLPASAENHREGEHDIMFTQLQNYSDYRRRDIDGRREQCNSEVEDIRSDDISGQERAFFKSTLAPPAM